MPRNEKSPNQFSDDSPISDQKDDAFYRHPFALRIAEMLRSRRDTGSTVIAIYGAWGEGKTTVLGFVKSELQASEEVVLLPFNPWRFGSDEQLLMTFFASLANALKAPLKTTLENVAGWFAEYGDIVIPNFELAYGAASVPAGDNVKKLADRFSTLDPETARDRIEKALLKTKKRIVILMDDIDRLDSDEIHQVFKLIKLTANFPCVDYLLAFDNEIAARALGKRYGGDVEMGHAFLEKIVQVPLPLPPASESSLRKFCFGAIDRVLGDSQIKITRDEASSFASEFEAALLPLLNTPRAAWRYANAIRFGLPAIKEEVNAVDFMLLEGARLFLPVVYKLVRKEGPGILHSHELSRDESIIPRMSESLDKLTKSQKAAAVDLLRFLLPQLQGVFPIGGRYGLTGYSDGTYEMWAKQRRLCVKEYFPRYFSLAIAPDDFSEEAISQLIVESSSGVEALLKWMDANVTQEKLVALVRKLYRRAEDIDSAGAEAICVALARRGEFFSDVGGIMALSPSRNVSSYFLETIGKKVDPKNRTRVALRVISEASTVYLAWDCVCYFSPTKKESHLGLISETESKKCRRMVAERALSGFETEVPWKSYSDTFIGILLGIARIFGRKKLEGALSEIFKKDPKSVLDFLIACAGKAIPLQTGISEPQDFETSHLRTLDKLFGKKKMYALVKKQAGHLPRLKDRLSTLKLEGGDKTAAQFLFAYEKEGEKQGDTESGDTESAAESDFED